MIRTEQATTYLKTILEGFCQNPVDILASIDEGGLFLDIKPSEIDTPYVIGKSGANIASIRNLMRLWGRKNRAQIGVLVKGDKRVYEKQP